MIDLVKAFDGTTQSLRAVQEALAIADAPPTQPEERALLETDVLLMEDTAGIDETDRKYARRSLEGDLRSWASDVMETPLMWPPVCVRRPPAHHLSPGPQVPGTH